ALDRQGEDQNGESDEERPPHGEDKLLSFRRGLRYSAKKQAQPADQQRRGAYPRHEAGTEIAEFPYWKRDRLVPDEYRKRAEHNRCHCIDAHEEFHGLFFTVQMRPPQSGVKIV